MLSPATIECCPLTPSGRGAVATIGVRGDILAVDPYFRAANGKSLAKQPIARICFGYWGQAPVQEEIVVVKSAADALELHCHGGPAAVHRILHDLQEVGGIVLKPEDWWPTPGCSWQSALQAECESALRLAITQKTAHHLLRQCTLFPAEMDRLVTATPEDRERSLQRMRHWTRFGQHLTVPWKIVLCGRPNVGKSSLINALVGYARSIVFDQPGTTRDVVVAETAFDGWPVELSDTAGIRHFASGDHPADSLEAAGIARARIKLREADLILLVLEAGQQVSSADRELAAAYPRALMVGNKCDLMPRTHNPSEPKQLHFCSAHTGEGIETLIRAIVQRIVPEEPDENTPFPVTEEQRRRLQDPDLFRTCRIELP